MRELFEEGKGPSPLDPGEATRASARGSQLRRFYKTVALAEAPEGVAVMLDGKQIKTPARRPLAAPSQGIAEAIAAEWQAQADTINPATMPLTRLANSIVDGVTARTHEVTADIAKFLESDLMFYRADAPQGLVSRQAQHWDPFLAWATDTFGARFMLAEGVMHVRQPEAAVHAVRRAIPAEPWPVGAVHAVTTLTGSALLALALARRFREADEIWAAAHVDDDWNMGQWGRDDTALARRVARRAEFDAAALVLNDLVAKSF